MWTTENMPDQSGKTAIVTGANTGIGYETALALYKAGAHVIIACRDQSKAEEALNRIAASGGKGSLEIILLDLASLQSVHSFSKIFGEKHGKLDLLINNAGVMMPPSSKTEEGFELQFGVNFIGHFALTGLLYPILKLTPGSRIVTVSSLAYLRGSIDFDNLKSEQSYDPVREYAQSKLADILLSLELQRRISKTGDKVVSIAAQPGANNTDLARHMSEEAYKAALERFGKLMDPWQGALPSLYAATSPDAEAAALYSPDNQGISGYPAKDTIQPHGLDEDVAKKLWEYAEKATGISFPG